MIDAFSIAAKRENEERNHLKTPENTRKGSNPRVFFGENRAVYICAHEEGA